MRATNSRPKLGKALVLILPTRAPRPLKVEFLGDDLAHDLVGARADRTEAGVTPGALDRVLHHVAVSAVDLERPVGDFDIGLRRGDLRHRDLLSTRQLL